LLAPKKKIPIKERGFFFLFIVEDAACLCGFSLVSAAKLAVHLVEIILVVVLPRDTLLLVL
jgi:hypothetical protein